MFTIYVIPSHVHDIFSFIICVFFEKRANILIAFLASGSRITAIVIVKKTIINFLRLFATLLPFVITRENYMNIHML